jgi:hypothetical protein
MQNNHFPPSPEFIITADELRKLTLAHGTLDERLALRDVVLARPHRRPSFMDEALNEGTGVYCP